MKKVLSLITGIAIVFALGSAYAAEGVNTAGDTIDRMITNDDLSHINLDQDRSTVNQMPSVSSEEASGSAAGGGREESDSTYKDMEQNKESIEKKAGELGVEGSGAGGGKDSDIGQKDEGSSGTKPVETTPSEPEGGRPAGESGGGMGGHGY